MAVPLTTSYQLITEQTIGNVYGSVILKCYAKYNQQDVANNRTEISVATNLYTQGSWWATGGQRWYAGAEGLTTAEGKAPDNYGAGQEVTLGTLTGWIQHADDGTKTMSVASGFVSTGFDIVATINGNVTLPTIQRASYPIDYVMTVSNDGNTITLKPTFTKYVSSFYQTLDVQLKTSSTTWQTLFTLSGVNSGTTYTLDGTQKQAIYNAIGTNTSQTFRYLLNTYISSGGQLVGNYGSNRTTTLPNYTISLNVSMADSVTAYNPYKPSGHENDTFIANLSKPTFGLTGASSTGSYYGRSLSYKLGDTTINTPYTENNYTGQSFSFVATDGRKSSSTITPTFTNIAYFRPTLTTKVVRPTPTGSTATVTVNGTFYDGTNLTNLETPEVQFAYIEEGGTQQIVVIPLTTSTSGTVTSFNGTATLTGLNYKKVINWSCSVYDKLGLITTNTGVLPEGLPLWNGYKRNDENYFNVNGNVIADTYNGYELDLNTNNTTDTWVPVLINNKIQHRVIPAKIGLEAYPVGSLYLTIDANASPASLFGGTWQRVANSKYLIGYDSANGYFNVADSDRGTTGGPGSWNTDGTAISVTQMPSHSHNGLRWATPTGSRISFNAGSGIQLSYSGGGSTAEEICTVTTGGGQAHNHFHVEPYYTVCVWKRTA